MSQHSQHPPGGDRQPNRLINETSTYLLQHAYNPVDWYPWGDEALQRARAENKPILLSVGYSACHWCHVMEHESFENPDTAELMNDLFVCIKVDREERPDIDDIYMKAVQMLTSQGGWPMTVFLTPDLKPFFGGTYFPPEDRHGLPGFRRILLGVNQAWLEQRENVLDSASELTEHLAMLDKIPDGDTELNRKLIHLALERLIRVFDDKCGGFGGAPKFPHTSSITLCMRHAAPGHPDTGGFADDCNNVVQITLDRMAYGGIHDQIGGGFARYAVDRIWLIPHFEKMLYDNALIARNYFDGYVLTGRTYWLDVARGILDFVLRELTTEDGVFYSSLDADSEGEEGKFYVWSASEIEEFLGADDGKWFCEVFDVNERGNFEHGKSVLHLADSPENIVRKYDITIERFWARVNPLKEKLLQERNKRTRPGRDDKVLTSWNALMISAFVDGYRVLGDTKYLEVAITAARFILQNMIRDGKLQRTYGRGQARLDAYLDDYAYMTQALFDLAAVDFDPLWLQQAEAFNKIVLDKFSNTDGSLFFTSVDHESLITRTRSFFDGSTPSATSVATFNLLRLARLSGDNALEKRAQTIMRLYSPYYQRVPDQFSNMLCALDFNLRSPVEIVLVADSTKEDWRELFTAISSAYLPDAVVLLHDISRAQSAAENKNPLTEGRGLVNGKPAVYICRNYACEQPLTDATEVRARIKNLSAQGS